MKILTLLRHAKSDWEDPSTPDFDRPLNPRGKAASRLIGAALRSSGTAFDLVLASPARRVVETLEGVAESYGTGIEPHYDERIYLAAPASLLEIVRTTSDDIGHLLIVGHNPGLERLALSLAVDDGSLRSRLDGKFPTGGMVEIAFAGGRWADVDEGSGSVRQFVVPRDLARGET